jgi:tetratricopeptide (TPR) repeat protein
MAVLKFIISRKKMFGQLFKDKFNIVKLFTNSNKKESKAEAISAQDIVKKIENEIARNRQNLTLKKDIKSKFAVKKQILLLILKKKALTTKNSYIKNAYKLLQSGSEDSIYEALDYLKKLPYEKFASSYLNELYRYKALIYELLEDFSEASNAYKKALKAQNNVETLQEFKEYMERYQKILKWQKNDDEKVILDQLYNVHNTTPIQMLPKSVAMLENIALYYARSPKSRSLGKRYFKEVLKIYKKLYEHDPQEYGCDYIRVLLDAVDKFMLTTLLLKEAQDILENPTICIEQRVELNERLKELKDKSFVKKSKIFRNMAFSLF